MHRRSVTDLEKENPALSRVCNAQKIEGGEKGPSGMNIGRGPTIDKISRSSRKNSTNLRRSFQGVLLISLSKRFDDFPFIPTRLGTEKLFGQLSASKYDFDPLRIFINIASKQVEGLGARVPKPTS